MEDGRDYVWSVCLGNHSRKSGRPGFWERQSGKDMVVLASGRDITLKEARDECLTSHTEDLVEAIRTQSYHLSAKLRFLHVKCDGRGPRQ